MIIGHIIYYTLSHNSLTLNRYSDPDMPCPGHVDEDTLALWFGSNAPGFAAIAGRRVANAALREVRTLAEYAAAHSDMNDATIAALKEWGEEKWSSSR